MISLEEWKYFPLSGKGGLFRIESCKCNNAGELLVDGDDIEYIGAKKNDNGFMRMVKYEESLVTKGNCIIFICDGQGSVGYTNYIGHDFIGSTTLSAGYNDNLNEKNALFLVTVLDLERYRYSFGRKYKTNLSKTKIKLPCNEYGDPDWDYMENFIKKLNFNKITTKNSIINSYDLNTSTWKEFYLHKLFNISMGNGIDAIATTNDNPKYNYVSRDSNGNGVVGFVDEVEGQKPFPAGAMSLALGGSFLGSCFIQKEPFYTAQNVGILQEKEPLNIHTKLFISTLIRNECKIKYQAFGRELNSHFRKDFTLKLPVLMNGNDYVIDSDKKYSKLGLIPDWKWMENYIKSLPYGDRIE
ncbi:restriction endonuclease subunit S [Helcococcus kunzii]|uniref:restriction endonuclease subunit S n=1 Tax=Helcococcus kunzii TaxID=40091 RepID=UPI0038A6BEE8